jgi:acetyltransferase
VFVDCAAAILADPNVDALLLTGLFGGYGIRFAEQYTDVEVKAATGLADLAADHQTPVVVQSAYEGFDTAPHAVLRERGLPVLESLDVASAILTAVSTHGARTRALAASSDFRLDHDRAGGTVEVATPDGRSQLSELESKRVLAASGLPVAPFEFVTGPDEAASAAADVDGPVALKIVTPDVVHKSDAGGVALDVDPERAGDVYDDLLAAVSEYDPTASLDGALVSPMRETGVELIVGVVDDPQFGPVVMCGLGGVFVEVLEDVAFRALPLTEADARAMLDDIDAQELLDGARGTPPVDRDAVVDLLIDVSEFVEAHPSVSELDLNPVFADSAGVEIIDAAITVAGGERRSNDTVSVPSPGDSDD